MIQCYFGDVYEHDMDLLFLEEFVCSDDFLQIFTEQIGIHNAKVLSVYSSKTDVSLGESDMTVVIETNNEKIGLLIEDKIDAVAMPEQAARYALRGQKGVEKGDYDRFFVFIIAPKKYLLQNSEAKKYPHSVEYERILSYFENHKDPRSEFKIQQIRQAIDKQKKGYQVEMDKAVTEFWNNYLEYQRMHYPEVDFIYRGEIKGANATWPRFRTVIDGLYLFHKSEFGFVDLTFDNCGDKIVAVERLLSDAVGDYLKQGYSVHKTSKSAAIRIMVPITDFHRPFEEQSDKVETVFKSIKKMTELAKLLSYQGVMNLLMK